MYTILYKCILIIYIYIVTIHVFSQEMHKPTRNVNNKINIYKYIHVLSKRKLLLL